FGQQRRHNIHFVVVGEGTEHIGVFDVFFFQQGLVGGAAQQHHGAIEVFTEELRTLFAVLNQFNQVIAFQRFRQPVTDVAATDDHNAAIGVFFAAQFVDDLTDVFFGRNKEHFVIGFNHGVAGRLNGFVTAEYGGHAGFDIGQVIFQVMNGVAHQRTAGIGAYRYQLHPAIGKIQYLQRPWVL